MTDNAKKEPMQRTNYFFPKEMMDRLKIAREQTKTPASELIRRFVDKGLREMGI